MNPLLYPTLLLAALAFWLGDRVGRGRLSPGWLLLGLALAAPGALFAIYYAHVLDRAAWFYQFRSLPLTELTAAGLGFPPGYLNAALCRRTVVGWIFLPALTALVVFIPYAKSVLVPLNTSTMSERWVDGVCRQSTASTCGPASAATLLKALGIVATERELARECYTYGSGTENWYLARALRRRGVRVRFVVTPREPETLLYPSIAGTTLGPGGAGHFVAVLGQFDGKYLIGDPAHGRRLLARDALPPGYVFTGFFMVVERPRRQG
jgi:predicted double-glycine peptidase